MYFENLGLSVPETMTEAEGLALQLTHEVESIEGQLSKNTEPKSDQSEEDFEKWKSNAEKALAIKKRQQDALSRWIDLHKTKVENAQPDVLVYEAFRLFQDLRGRGVELAQNERTFMNVLECYLRDRTGMVS
jgi:hypothetical protein